MGRINLECFTRGLLGDCLQFRGQNQPCLPGCARKDDITYRGRADRGVGRMPHDLWMVCPAALVVIRKCEDALKGRLDLSDVPVVEVPAISPALRMWLHHHPRVIRVVDCVPRG